VRKDQVGWLPQLQLDHDRGRLIVGGDVYTFHSNHWGDVLNVDGIGPVNQGEGLKFHDFTGDKDAWSAFANVQYEILAGVTVLGDLQYQHRRYDMIQEQVGNFRETSRHGFSVDYQFFNPRGGIYWQLPNRLAGGTLGFYGHVGTTQLEPSLYDLYDTWLGPEVLGVEPLFRQSRPVMAGDGVTVDYLDWSGPLIEPERAVNYEIGTSFRSGRLSATVNGYWMDIENEIVPFGGIYLGYGVKGNAEKTRHRGIELDLTAQVAAGHLLKLVASRSWDEFDRFVYTFDPDSPDDFSGNPIALFPEYLATATWRADWGMVDSALRWRAVGTQYLDNSGDDKRIIDAYSVLDFALGADLMRLGLSGLSGARLQLRLRNLLNEKYETNGYFDPWFGASKIPAAERNFLVGVDYSF
jgi:iron complex outermembrane receptor protein